MPKPGDTEVIESNDDGELIRTYSAAGYTETFVWRDGPPQLPLDAAGALATLLATKGLTTTEEAAAAVGLQPEQLVAEAEAWAVVAAEKAKQTKR